MRILSADEMRTTDRVTAETYGVSSIDLMRHAGAAVARFVVREFSSARSILVFCGRGNNGGDGFVAARELIAAGRRVHVLLLGDPAALKGDAKIAFEEMAMEPVLVREEADLGRPDVRELFENADLLLDAVVGTGFQPPLRGTAAALRDRVNALEMPVIAVDLPSGWGADSREFAVEGAFRADAVVTFTAPKLAHVCGNLCGSVYAPIVVAPIGSPDAAIRSTLNLSWSGAAKAALDGPRRAESNKGNFGHVLLVGGARGKSGAPAMASLAALRAGAGLVTTAVAESILPLVAAITPELMTEALPEAADGGFDLERIDFDALLDRITVLAIGPGLGQSPSAEKLVLELLERTTIPVVLDADALNIMAKHIDKLDGRGRTMVLTPHPGEMGRLAGIPTQEVQARREPLAREFAAKHHVTLVLKGWRTLVAQPDGQLAINTSGNPGMAKGGSGDILTGMVAALLAQHPKQAAEAVSAAVYLHGLAADFAVREQDERTLLATDTVAHLWRAYRFSPQDAAGFTWLAGLPQDILEALEAR
ncbi:NAD(P)H-hydrate dehydratase [Silvibacterium dinghuense]|uniref:Bifunctional NAD(P)H-hydrate repair enzyme n=1 Tax=Silvibacterium dinghuense TaxID=1560006 RepID=A0A4Q1SIQ9_9BACT|nr:NAD(P)H-hydrate dehydratase [Silvibacterium dinghuense]RXS97120.1 NAD(P)H-hydrate dehydratase [Silvibacterium dinghuense]GGG96415.1 bifunctional NAD(P)H-hydrate repair enzyme Nnr [Silvibacterium dinghuense]